MPVWSAFRHHGVARRLVHDLKYRGIVAVAGALAPPMVEHLPTAAAGLVPVPRVALRRLLLGVDPARELASAMSRLCGLPVVDALQAPVWQPGHAGKARTSRRPVSLRQRRRVEQGVLIDDVLTTGSTLRAAIAALGPDVVGAVTATGAGV